MNETQNDLPRSSKLSEILKRHDVSAATYSRMPVKLDVFYVGRSPRATLDSERAWLRELQAQAQAQREINSARGRATVAARLTRKVSA